MEQGFSKIKSKEGFKKTIQLIMSGSLIVDNQLSIVPLSLLFGEFVARLNFHVTDMRLHIFGQNILYVENNEGILFEYCHKNMVEKTNGKGMKARFYIIEDQSTIIENISEFMRLNGNSIIRGVCTSQINIKNVEYNDFDGDNFVKLLFKTSSAPARINIDCINERYSLIVNEIINDDIVRSNQPVININTSLEINARINSYRRIDELIRESYALYERTNNFCELIKELLHDTNISIERYIPMEDYFDSVINYDGNCNKKLFITKIYSCVYPDHRPILIDSYGNILISKIFLLRQYLSVLTEWILKIRTYLS